MIFTDEHRFFILNPIKDNLRSICESYLWESVSINHRLTQMIFTDPHRFSESGFN